LNSTQLDGRLVRAPYIWCGAVTHSTSCKHQFPMVLSQIL